MLSLHSKYILHLYLFTFYTRVVTNAILYTPVGVDAATETGNFWLYTYIASFRYFSYPFTVTDVFIYS